MSGPALFERLWSGAAAMEEWTAAVSGGVTTHVGEGIIAVHASYFCGSVAAIRTTEGLVLIDTGGVAFAKSILDAIRAWDDSIIHTVIYTHGHVDHTSGISGIDAEAQARGVSPPRIVAHRHVQRRLDRYVASHGYNSFAQGQQFNTPGYVYPIGQRGPDLIYDDARTLHIGGVTFDLRHGRGETDDATYVWLPQRRVLASGDFVIWMFPNAGNPRKVQRYAAEWAAVLRRMQDLKPDALIPGHGPVVFGAARAAQMLGDGAEALEYLNDETLRMLNQGAPLDQVLHAVKLPARFRELPYLRATYDDPEFLVRAIYHFYAGWFDGNPAHLKPAPAAELAAELAQLVGGAGTLAARAAALAHDGKLRLAAHLAEFAAAAAPADAAIQHTRAAVLAACANSEESLMAGAFYSAAGRDAERRSLP